MTQNQWLNQHYISAGTVIETVVVLIVASVAMFVVNRLLRQWLAYLQGRLRQSDETNVIISRIVTAATDYCRAFSTRSPIRL
jgi:hypothetical protein